MRIVGGTWRGLAVEAPAGRGVTRPTTDRTRESIASMVLSARGLSLAGDVVLDAFAGSGALGLELVSRGADSATLVDSSRAAIACARRNVARLDAAGKVNVVLGDIFKLAARPIMGAPFSIVVLDPPYATSASSLADLIVTLSSSGMLARGTLVVYEHSAQAPSIEPGRVPGCVAVRTRRHGVTACDVLTV